LSVTPTYPGIYIQELPSTSHSVTAAPTAVTVFVGYTNPFWLAAPEATPPPFGQATEVQSFAEYAALFGGFFSCPWLTDYVGHAVYQFFLNGGSDAYIVGIETKAVEAPTASLMASGTTGAGGTGGSTGTGFTFTALQPTGTPASGSTPAQGMPMTVALSNVITTAASDDTADVTIVYGTTVETYRRLPITSLVSTINSQSQLANVAAPGSPTSYSGLPTQQTPFTYATAPTSGTTVFKESDFTAVFAANGSLDKVAIFNLMVLPGVSDATVLAAALSFSEGKKAFLIMDPPVNGVADTLAAELPGVPSGAAPIATIWNGGDTSTPAPPVSPNGAIYFPYLQFSDPVTGDATTSPPSGFVAGIFAAEDSNRGVWKSPAGLETTITGTTGVVPWGVMTDQQQGVLNPLGINAIRTFPGIGSVVFGARTLVADNPAFQQWEYVAVRRMALFIEQSLQTSLRWAVFEPNATPLWNALTQEISAFLLGLFRQGAFAGTTADQAFQVQCDATTTSPTDIANGIVNVLVSFAPLSPAEFVVIKISQLAGQSQS